METEASINRARAENYRAKAVLMREMGATMSDERMRLECLELAAKWDVLAERLDFLRRF